MPQVPFEKCFDMKCPQGLALLFIANHFHEETSGSSGSERVNVGHRHLDLEELAALLGLIN